MSEIQNGPATPAIDAGSDADVRPNKVGPLAGRLVDRRTHAGRRRAELIDAFTAALAGPLDAIQTARVSEAAELQVVAELARAAFLRGGGATADDVVRCSRAASLAEKRLRLSERQARSEPSLAAYLAEKQAAKPPVAA